MERAQKVILFAICDFGVGRTFYLSSGPTYGLVIIVIERGSKQFGESPEFFGKPILFGLTLPMLVLRN